MTTDELLNKLGMAFRSLSLHSNGDWIAKGGHNYFNTKIMVRDKTPQEALEKLLERKSNEFSNQKGPVEIIFND